MVSKMGRNDPCSCGSGKKFKKCCLGKVGETVPSTSGNISYRFEAGSYGDAGDYMPSIACLKQNDRGESTYHFVLIKPSIIHLDEDDAVSEGENDLEIAFKAKHATGSDEILAEKLKELEYVNVDNFKIVQRDDKFQA